MKTPSLLACLLVVGSVTLPPSVLAGEMFSNLSNADAGGWGSVSNYIFGPGEESTTMTFDCAAQFTTDASAPDFLLQGVTLKLGEIGSGGGFTVGIHADNAGLPGTLLQTLSGPADPSGGGEFAYTAAALSLASSTSYWIVASASAPSGSYNWMVTQDFSHTGAWTATATAQAQNGAWSLAGDWEVFQFSVAAVAVPEPAVTGLLIGMGALAPILIYRKGRRQKKGATPDFGV